MFIKILINQLIIFSNMKNELNNKKIINYRKSNGKYKCLHPS